MLPQPVVGVHNLSEKPPPHTKNIEIYATLPKKKSGVISRVKNRNNESPTKNIIEDAEYLIYDRPGRDKNRGRDKNDKALSPVKEKRARSEERNKKTEFNTTQQSGKENVKKPVKEIDIKGNNKKQHKIRRKLLMGGLIKRKNRSMPDLREDEDLKTADLKTQDDSNIKSTTLMEKQLSGYLSEGHLEFAGNATNPNLERSRLMRKSFHGSAGKVLHAAKVPPPPPLRTTSQLSKNSDRPKYPLPNEAKPYNNIEKMENGNFYNFDTEPRSLPFLPTYTADTYTVYRDDPVQYANTNICMQNESTQLVTRAQIHQAPNEHEDFDSNTPNLPLPPYPSPLNSVVHSRQASEEFPPPPEEVLHKEESSLLSQLQMKRQQILTENSINKIEKQVQENNNNNNSNSANPLMKELQAKIQQKLNKIEVSEDVVDFVSKSKTDDSEKMNSVRDLASKFEHIRMIQEENEAKEKAEEAKRKMLEETEGISTDVGPIKRFEPMMGTNFTTSVLKLTGGDDDSKSDEPGLVRRKSGGKKKNVTFCDQVVLVATADDDEEDNFIPNPILERVLRSAMNKEPGDSNKVYNRSPETSEPEKMTRVPSHYPKATLAYSQNVNHNHHPDNNKLNEQLNSDNTRLVTSPENLRNQMYSQQPQRVNAQPYSQSVETMRNNFHVTSSQPIIRQPENSRIVHQYSSEQDHQKIQNYPQNENFRQSHIPQLDMQRYTAQVYSPPPESPRMSQHHYSHQAEPPRNYHPQYASPPENPRINQQYENSVNGQYMQPTYDSQKVNAQPYQQQNGQVNAQPYQQQNGQVNAQSYQQPNGQYNHIENSRPVQQSHPYMHVPQLRTQCYPNSPESSQNRFSDLRKPINDQNDKSASVRLAIQKTPQMARASMAVSQNSQNPHYQPVPNVHRPQNPTYQMLPKNSPARMVAAQPEIKSNFPPYYHPLPNKTSSNQTSYPRSDGKSRIPQSAFPPYQQPPPPKQVPNKFVNKTEKPNEQINGKINETRQSQENLLQGNVRTNPCHLCRKKQVVLPAMYCPDCDFYMSRFRPKS